MISQEEYDRIQLILGRPGKPAPNRHRFPFTGLIRCGECSSMVTAASYYQIICPACKKKFSARNKKACQSCSLKIEKMKKPTRLFYVYYYCTKRRNGSPPCFQKSVRSDVLEQQISEILSQFTISEALKLFAVETLQQEDRRDQDTEKGARHTLIQRQEAIRRQLAHINDMILSPETDWSLVTHDEVRVRKQQLLEELDEIGERLTGGMPEAPQALRLTEKTFLFARYAQFWFQEGDEDQKRAILAALGSNLTLKDQKLALELRKPLRLVKEMRDSLLSTTEPIEPEKQRSVKPKEEAFTSSCPYLQRRSNVVRTYWETACDPDPFPVFELPAQQAA